MFYLANTRSKVKDRLYPIDCEKIINQHMGFYNNKLRPRTSRLMKMLTRRFQEEAGLAGDDTPRGQPRMSISVDPANLEPELDAVAKLLQHMNTKLTQS